MLNKILKIFKETAVPSTWVSDAIYFINTASSSYLEIYVTSSTGVPDRLINESDIQALITSTVSAQAELLIVSDITARNALTLTTTKAVYVQNATGDPTVSSGGAYYLYNPSNSSWIKTAEAESMDIALTWANISGKPTSSAAQIDSAVANSHTHTNKTQLDKVGQDGSGNFTYNNALPYTGWETTTW